VRSIAINGPNLVRPELWALLLLLLLLSSVVATSTSRVDFECIFVRTAQLKSYIADDPL